MKRHILFILTLLLFFHAKSQPNCIFTHYSSENGLSQNSIMSMVQDHNGVLWFSTWDGINRFNGYDFKVYKARQGNKITMTNNRVDLLEVDPYKIIFGCKRMIIVCIVLTKEQRNSNKFLPKVKRRACVSLLLKYCPTVSFGYFLKMRGLSV